MVTDTIRFSTDGAAFTGGPTATPAPVGTTVVVLPNPATGDSVSILQFLCTAHAAPDSPGSADSAELVGVPV